MSRQRVQIRFRKHDDLRFIGHRDLLRTLERLFRRAGLKLRMSEGFHLVVCGSLVPDPLQTLEPVTGPEGPALKNEMMLPSVLDPWAAHALYEAAHLMKNVPGSKVWLVSLGPKAKLQQLMTSVAQKVPFEFVALDGPARGGSG